MKKAQNVIHLKGGELVFFEKVIESTPEGLIVERISKEGRIARVQVPAASVAFVEYWEEVK